MSKVKHNIIANFLGKGWKALISLAFVPFYIKFMGIEAYGLIGIFASLQVIFSLMDMGLSTTLNREMARLSGSKEKADIQKLRDTLRTLEIPYWGIAVVLAVLMISLSWPIAQYWIKSEQLSITSVQRAVMIMGFVAAAQWPVSLYSGGLRGLQRQVLLNVIVAVFATISGVGAILVLWLFSPTVEAFFIWQMIVGILRVFTLAFFLWRVLPSSGKRACFRQKLLSDIWRFAAGMTGITLAAILLTQIDKIILSKMLTLKMFGYFVLANLVARSLMRIIAPIFSAIFPRFSQLIAIGDEKKLKDFYHKSCQFMSLMIVPAGMIIAFFSYNLMCLWTGNIETANHTYIFVSLLVVGTMLNGFMNLPYALQLAYGWTSLAFYCNVFAVIIMVPLTIVLVFRFQAIGGAIAYIILNSGYVIIAIQLMHRRILKDEKWRWYLQDIGRPVVIAFLSGGLCWQFSKGIEINYWYQNVVVLFCSSAFCFLTTACSIRFSREYMFNFLRKIKA